MADVQQLIFDIITRDRASEGFRKVGEAAKAAAGDTSTLNRRLDEVGKKSATARVILAGDKEAQAALDKMDAKLVSLNRRTANPNISIEGAARATAEVSALDLELDKIGSKGGSAESAASGLSAVAGTGGIPGGGMGALIGAGVVLSPVLATLTFGLGGFGAAAIGVIKPIENAAQKTGGLSANMKLLNPEQQAVARGLLGLGQEYDRFQKSLQPQVFGVFNAGLHLAGNLLHDVQPVAKATGTALDGLLGRVDAEFQSGTWQSFFGFMAKNAGPDVKLVGDSFIHLLDALPPLLQDLNPLAVGLLKVTDQAIQGAGKISVLIGDIEHLGTAAVSLGQKTSGSNSPFAFLDNAHLLNDIKFVNDLLPRAFQHAAEGAAGTKLPMNAFFQSTQKTAAGAHAAAAQVQSLTQQVTGLQTAETKSLDAQLAYSNALISSKNDSVSLKTALKASNDQIGLQTAKQRASFSAANTFITDLENTAKQAWASGKGVDGQISAIRTGLPILDQAKTKNKAYWQEVQTLVSWLHKLQSIRQIKELVKVTGTGNWQNTAGELPGQPGMHSVPPGGASGMYIRSGTTPTADDVLIRASRGELVVPTNLVNAGAVDHLRGRIPGFAGGGIIPHYSGDVKGLVPWGQHNRDVSVHQIVAGIARGMASSFASMFGGGGLGSVAPASGSALAAQNYARSLLTLYGWSQSQMGSLIPLWNQESGWNAYAVNPSSGAYGIPQSLGHGHPYNLGDYKNQVIWGLNYIRGRYGSPAGAEAHELSFGWYDQGGHLPPGLSLAYNGTGRPEPVGGGGTVININVSVPPTVNPRDAGRQFADVLKAYIKAGGTLYPAGVTPR